MFLPFLHFYLQSFFLWSAFPCFCGGDVRICVVLEFCNLFGSKEFVSYSEPKSQKGAKSPEKSLWNNFLAEHREKKGNFNCELKTKLNSWTKKKQQKINL